MADLVTTSQNQNGSGGQIQTTKSKTRGSMTKASKEIIINVEEIDATFGAGFGSSVLKKIVARKDELQGIASEAEQIEYMMALAGETAQQEGAAKGRNRAEQEIRAKRIEALRQEAEKFIADSAQFYDGLVSFGFSPEAAIKQLEGTAKQHYIKLNAVKEGDVYSWDNWEFTLKTEQE